MRAITANFPLLEDFLFGLCVLGGGDQNLHKWPSCSRAQKKRTLSMISHYPGLSPYHPAAATPLLFGFSQWMMTRRHIHTFMWIIQFSNHRQQQREPAPEPPATVSVEARMGPCTLTLCQPVVAPFTLYNSVRACYR